ncbi:hypothetical protein B7C51_06070 [Paenibacillus larvae subsp. pulvifaciens]|uniref:Uncharacterized protein n=1 Tax=Paenibacillus larvae subsp. pulvifaciens TaxID=1477 RepID=A0A1V0UQB3_9BACL|nr:hypothetical protein B7C51_06070 [Paenibacillus larvae subsp. pulvifaciens]
MVTLIKSREVQEERPCLNSINMKIMMATTRMDKIMTLKVIPNEEIVFTKSVFGNSISKQNKDKHKVNNTNIQHI